MKPYLDLMQLVLDQGVVTPDRTGTGRKRLFGHTLRFDLREGFPLVTTKKLFLRGVCEELEWFISGSSNADELSERDVHIWDGWKLSEQDARDYASAICPYPIVDGQHDEYFEMFVARLKGSVGPMYGHMWRKAPGKRPGDSVDQLAQVLSSLKKNPYSARHLISSWVPGYVADESLSIKDNVLAGNGALAPCHVLMQFFVAPAEVEGGKMRLSLRMDQRSADLALGVPFNIAQYALILALVAHECGYEACEFIWQVGDVHLYLDHLETAKIQLERTPRKLPTLAIADDFTSILDFKAGQVAFEDYDPHPKLDYPISI